MNYYERAVFALNGIKHTDDNVVAGFIFGSFVAKETSLKSYEEIQIFNGADFLLSKFNLVDLPSDIDFLCVCKDVAKMKPVFDEIMMEVLNPPVTVNVVSKEVFEKEISLNDPSAIKRIILYKKLLVLKGEEYLQTMKKKAVKEEKPDDKIFQKEFDFKKEYLRLLTTQNIVTFSIDANNYQQLFPNLLKMICGELGGGFPVDRLKIVYPKPMNLKSRMDLSKNPISQDLI